MPYHAPAPGFLPPAGASAPPAARPVVVDRYSSLRTRSLLAVRWLWFMVVLGLGALAVDFDWLGEKSSPSWTYDELISIGHLMDIAALVQLITYLIAAVIFIVWFHCAYSNLRALGVPKPRHANGWAIGAWFTPFVSLIWPKQLGNDIWRAGDPALQPGDHRWHALPVAALVHWWWALWLIGNAANVVANNMITEADSMAEFQTAVIADAASQVLGLLSIFAAMLFVKRASARQEARALTLRRPGAA
jgi:hypothetical protein